jgi:hypothetical protein
MWWSVPRSPPQKRCLWRGLQGVGQRGRGGELAETVAPRRLRGAPEEVGGRANAVMDRPEQEDKPTDYERLCASGEALVYAVP